MRPPPSKATAPNTPTTMPATAPELTPECEVVLCSAGWAVPVVYGEMMVDALAVIKCVLVLLAARFVEDDCWLVVETRKESRNESDVSEVVGETTGCVSEDQDGTVVAEVHVDSVGIVDNEDAEDDGKVLVAALDVVVVEVDEVVIVELVDVAVVDVDVAEVVGVEVEVDIEVAALDVAGEVDTLVPVLSVPLPLPVLGLGGLELEVLAEVVVLVAVDVAVDPDEQVLTVQYSGTFT
jgi:hypothetical protein